ncbi:MAG: hypothetical protein GYB68_06485 [Chloroflexi bacterium]|nr:hypothetical protein [Chloroflexota bacterium]
MDRQIIDAPAQDQSPSASNGYKPAVQTGNSQEQLNRIAIASLLIVAGLVLLANQLGFLPAFGGGGIWEWMALIAGGVLLAVSAVRVVSPDVEANIGVLILGGILLFTGASQILDFDPDTFWPALLIIIGVSVLAKRVADR